MIMKNKGLIIVIIILSLLVAYFFITNKSGTLKKEDKDFAVQDTASIYRIFLADKGSHQVLIERQQDGGWKVNGKYPARKDAIRVLLETLKRMEVKAPVAKAAHDNVIKSIAAGAIKVELYEKDEDEPFKVINVGGETPDHLGTYMLLENSSAPFVLQIPGFNGYLSSRFIVTEEGWRDRSVFSYSNPLAQIREISLENFNKPNESFKIELNNGQVKAVTALKTSTPIEFDSEKVIGYVSKFTQISFESIVKGLSPNRVDSIVKSVPVFILTIKENNGKEKSLIMHPMAAAPGELDVNGNPLKYDLDRFYIQIVSSEEKDLVVAQYYIFDRLIKPFDYFKK